MAGPQISFGRVVKLRVYATQTQSIGGVPTISYDNGYTEFVSVTDSGDVGFRIRGRITQVDATVGVGINPITFDIYNLGADSRAILQSKVGTKIEIYAGYGANVQQIGLGNILWARTKKVGADFITSVIAGDSYFALANGEINKSFSGTTTFQTVVDALMDALSVVGMFKGTQDIPPGSWNTGYVLVGSPLNNMSEICKKMGRTMFILGNQVNIIKTKGDVGLPDLEISVDTGMVGIPEVNPPGVIGVIPDTDPVSPQNNLSFSHLMRPELTIFRRVRITSRFVNGLYIISRTVHEFDSWSGSFNTNCEAFLVNEKNG